MKSSADWERFGPRELETSRVLLEEIQSLATQTALMKKTLQDPRAALVGNTFEFSYLLVTCDDPTVGEQIVCHGAHGLLDPLTLAVLFSLQTGVFILRLRSTDDRQHPAGNQFRRLLHGLCTHLHRIQS